MTTSFPNKRAVRCWYLSHKNQGNRRNWQGQTKRRAAVHRPQSGQHWTDVETNFSGFSARLTRRMATTCLEGTRPSPSLFDLSPNPQQCWVRGEQSSLRHGKERRSPVNSLTHIIWLIPDPFPVRGREKTLFLNNNNSTTTKVIRNESRFGRGNNVQMKPDATQTSAVLCNKCSRSPARPIFGDQTTSEEEKNPGDETLYLKDKTAKSFRPRPWDGNCWIAWQRNGPIDRGISMTS